MSKKKDRKIKRLQNMPLWPAVLEMIITELVILSLTVFICTLSVFGIINTLVLNKVKICRDVVELVNDNWGTLSQAEIEEKFSRYVESYPDINDIYIVSDSEIENVIPRHKQNFDDDVKKIYEKSGMMHFIDSDHDKPFFNMMFTSENQPEVEPDFQNRKSDKPIDPELKRQSEEVSRAVENELGVFLYNPKNLFKTMDIERVITDKSYIDWATTESSGLHTVSLFRTDISDVNICFKTVYKLNGFQFNLIATIVIFFLIVLIFSGIYEISKVVKLIHERKRVNKLVTTDTVTGGYNKDYFSQKAQKEISRKRRNYVVVQLRLEKYRNYCTAYGIVQGENLLEEINAHLVQMNVLRERKGGQHLTFSAGVCPVKSKNDEVSQLLSCAGVAIPKESKVQDEIVWFNDSMKEEQVWERRIEDDMEKAIENHEFQVYLQPKYSTKEEVLSAAEALVRWIHPVLGFISPGRFIPIFEKNGFILQLDDYMLTEVAKLQSAWKEQGKKMVPISVNVSRAHFAEENLAEHICSIVDEYNVPHEYIELELTESAFFDDKSILLTTVSKLKSFGFKVSMDDFGAGYSSLNSLKELPLDIIKLDAEFFRGVDDIDRSNLIVGETIALAKKLGMEIVAEGIETREQVDFLAKQDCDLIQGFYFSKPLPVKEFEERAYGK